jgi:membrane associated rhomboid family serine protease
MLPLRDNVPTKRFPGLTYALIAVNAWFFLQELRMGRRLEPFILHWGLVPRRLDPVTLVTSMFLHGGWMHLISNMWVLKIFGDNIEDKLGPWRFLWFYLFSGIIAGLVQVYASAGSSVPTIGASGAIAGVMGAYFVLYPRARIACLVPIFFFWIETIQLPAFVFLGVWLWTQVWAGSHAFAGAGGVAWWAHVGGFAGGIGLLGLFSLL